MAKVFIVTTHRFEKFSEFLTDENKLQNISNLEKHFYFVRIEKENGDIINTVLSNKLNYSLKQEIIANHCYWSKVQNKSEKYSIDNEGLIFKNNCYFEDSEEGIEKKKNFIEKVKDSFQNNLKNINKQYLGNIYCLAEDNSNNYLFIAHQFPLSANSEVSTKVSYMQAIVDDIIDYIDNKGQKIVDWFFICHDHDWICNSTDSFTCLNDWKKTSDSEIKENIETLFGRNDKKGIVEIVDKKDIFNPKNIIIYQHIDNNNIYKNLIKNYKDLTKEDKENYFSNLLSINNMKELENFLSCSVIVENENGRDKEYSVCKIDCDTSRYFFKKVIFK